MHRAEFGSAVSAIMTMPHFALIIEITPLKEKLNTQAFRQTVVSLVCHLWLKEDAFCCLLPLLHWKFTSGHSSHLHAPGMSDQLISETKLTQKSPLSSRLVRLRTWDMKENVHCVGSTIRWPGMNAYSLSSMQVMDSRLFWLDSHLDSDSNLKSVKDLVP